MVYLAAFTLNFLLELSFAVLDQVVLHAAHELSHVAHDDLRPRLPRLLGARDEVVYVLRERGALVGGQVQRVRSYRRAASASLSCPL